MGEISQESLDPKSTLCTLRWDSPTIDLSKGDVRLCCRTPARRITVQDIAELGTDAILNSQYDRLRRWDMFQGIRHPECVSCWQAESNGMPSPRVGAEKLLDEKLNSLSPWDLNSPVLRSHSLRIAEVQLGNLCDQKCIYCWRQNSSRWAKEDFEFGEITQREYEELIEGRNPEFKILFWKWFEDVAGSVEIFSVLGGEPTYYPELPDIIEQAHSLAQRSGNQRMKLRIITNLNCTATALDNLIAVLKKIDRHGRTVIIDTSLESIGRNAEVVRFGMSWRRVDKNIRNLLSQDLENLHFTFIPSMHALGVTRFIDFLKYARGLGQDFNRRVPLLKNSVNKPSYFATSILTPDFKICLNEVEALLMEATEQHFPEVERVWGPSWSVYADFVEEVRASIRHNFDANCPVNIIRDRISFLLAMTKSQNRRGYVFSEEFPEYVDFFESCRHLAKEVEADPMGQTKIWDTSIG